MDAVIERPAVGEAVEFGVTGMSCASCVRRVERALEEVPGVDAVSVNLLTERVRVLGAASSDLAGLKRAVERAGYGAATVEVELAIDGMTCASCVRRVERALGRVGGVLDVRVSLATERAHVTALAGSGELAERLLRAVRDGGYRARPPAPAGRSSGRESSRRESSGRGAGPAERRETARVMVAAALTAPLLATMIAGAFGDRLLVPPFAQFALATIVQFALGARFYVAAFRAVRAGTGNMDLLVALGSTAAWGLSTAELIGTATGGGTTPALYYDSSSLIVSFVLFGRWLERRARRRTVASIQALAELRPDTARVRRDGAERSVPLAELAPGDEIVVRPGERIPADGRVIEGGGGVDLSLLTGETVPADTVPGDLVPGGALAVDGVLVLAVTATGAETVLSRIVRLVETAQGSKAPVERLVDRISAVFVPVVLLGAAATFAARWMSGDPPAAALLAAVAVTVIACPCALGLATPTATVVGIGAAARGGILIRDSEALERAHAVGVVLFDKTGTLTEGRPELASVEPAANVDPAEILRLAASLLAPSEHPLAAATRARAAAEDLGPEPVTSFRALAGSGVEGEVGGRRFLLGNHRLLAEHGLAPPADAGTDGRTVSFLAEAGPDGRILATLRFADRVRASAPAAIRALRARGIRTAMLTGDTEAAAREAARTAGIDEVHAALRPEDKAGVVAALRRPAGPPGSPGRVIAMVGDGINDAPALAAADIGIAVASGTDLAVASAAIVLLRPDPLLVADAIDISRRTRRTIRRGLFWAFGYNVVGIPLAALGFLSPALSGLAMALSSVSVVGNALLLRRWQPRREADESAGAP